MKTPLLIQSVRRAFVVGLCFTAGGFAALNAHAGLTLEMHLYRYQTDGYAFYTPLTTNATSPAAPLGTYLINSPNWPGNGSSRQFELTTNGLAFVTGGEFGYNNFVSAMQQITNGDWTILVTNATSTNLYKFKVTAPTINSNLLPATTMTFPTYGALHVTNQPTFTWEGPTNWPVTGTLFLYDNQSFFQFTNIPAAQTSWTSPVTLPPTNYSFQLNFVTNYTTALFVTSTPLNTNNSQPISGWSSTTVLESDSYIPFTVSPFTVPSSGHTNVAYYSFEDNNLFAHDFSGHSNDVYSYGWSTTAPYMTNDFKAGAHAVGLPGSGWLYPSTNLLAPLAASFSVSVWLKTTGVYGNDNDPEYSAAGIVSALSGNYDLAVMPMGITGSKLAFYTGGSPHNVLRSQASINTGQYVHLVVTRDQRTGEKKIYVNGALDASVFAATDLLNGPDPSGLAIGENNGQAIRADMDEIQFYSGVLSGSEVMQLYNNPGTKIPDDVGIGHNGVVAHYDFDEGLVLAPDVSGHSNDLVHAGYFAGAGPAIDTDSVAGAGSISFDGGSYLTAPSNLLATLAGNFSISLWVKTMDNSGEQYGYAYDGAGIISADDPNPNSNDLIPVALTGGQVAFNTANTDFSYDDTINSSALVNDGDAWHHVVVTRDRSTGEKVIYVDGVLDTSDVDATNLLNDPRLLTLGCKADTSNPDPASPDDTGSNGYTGLLDDIQIYDRVLNIAEVAFLHDHPGQEVGFIAPPVNAQVRLEIHRNLNGTGTADEYYAFPFLESISAPVTTFHEITSPNGYFRGRTNTSSSFTFASLDSIIQECTNGNWSLILNANDPSEHVYSFKVSISGLNTNVLGPVKILVPANGSSNVATNTAFQWSGPTNFPALLVGDSPISQFANLPSTATNWPSPPTLPFGTNQFFATYTSNNVATITFTTPMDASSNLIAGWVASATLVASSFSTFVVGSGPATPVVILNPQKTGGGLQFSFMSQNGHPHIIEANTNLLKTNTWITLSNFTGDGTLKQFTFPVTNPSVRYFRVRTQ